MTTGTQEYDVLNHPVVTHDEWVRARSALLAREKEFTRLRDQVSQARRDLPWERVEKRYVFEAPEGKLTLGDAFGAQSQLIVYHFMYAPDWDEGCPSCSFWADNFNGIEPHLKARDVAFVAISRAPLDKLEAYKRRMGWGFRWLSSGGTGFNEDYGVSFTPEQLKGHAATYNYATIDLEDETDLPGISVFYKNDAGEIFHTYSTYGRGIDLMNGAYNYLDLAPKGRDEGGRIQSWVRRHDQY